MAVGTKVKGITIEFNAETTKLGQALKQIDAKAAGVDKSLRAVNKSLKFNPGNTELLAQKQQLLSQKIEQTKSRLEALRTTQAKLDDDPSVDKTSQEYMELRREIIETESKLRHFENEAKKLNNIKLQALGQQMDKIGQKMQSVGKGMSKYVTAPIVALGAASIAAFKQVDAGMDIIVQKTGATGTALTQMQDQMKELATEIPTDFETAGAAIGEVNTRFELTGDELKALSGQFIKFAKLNGTDVSSSIDKVQKAMSAYGLKTEDVSGLLDDLNKVGQDTGIGMDQLADSLVKNAPALQGMGLSAKESATFLGQLEKSGADSAKVLSGLNRAIGTGAKEGKSMADVLDEIQTNIVDAKDDTEAMAAAAELFGTKAGPQIATAARNGSLNFKALGKEAKNAAGSVSTTFENTLDPMDEFTMLANQMKVTGAEVGVAVLRVLAPAMKKLAEKVKDLTAKWKALSPQQQQMITKVAGLVAAIGPLLIVGGKLVSGVGKLVTWGARLGGSLGSLVTRFVAMTGPVGVAVGLMTGLAVALGKAAAGENKYAAAAKKAHEQREASIASAAAEGATLELYADQLDELSKKENKSASDKAMLKTYVDKLNEAIPSLGLAYDAETDSLNKGTGAIRQRIAAYKSEAMVTAYQAQITQAAEARIKSEERLKALEDDLTKTQAAWTAARKRGDTETMRSMESRTAAIRKNIQAEKGAVKLANDDINRYTNSIKKELEGTSEAAKVSGKKTTSSYASGLADEGALAQVGKNAAKMGASAKSSAGKTSAYSIGEKFTMGFANGLVSVASMAKVLTNAAMVARKAEQAARSKKGADEHSPSKKAFKLGEYWTEGFALGISEQTPMAIKAVQDQIKAVRGTYETAALATAPMTMTGTMSASNVNLANEVANALLPILQSMVTSGDRQPIVIDNYLYPNGPKMGETIVDTYDEYKRRLG